MNKLLKINTYISQPESLVSKPIDAGCNVIGVVLSVSPSTFRGVSVAHNTTCWNE